MSLLRTGTLLLFASLATRTTAFDLVRDHSGQTFFDGWDFYGSWDNLTLGDVNWLNESDARAQNLAYVNPAGNAIIKVDNTSTVPFNEKRNTIRITTKDFYDYGSLWIIDVLHLPFGCSVWPAFWSKGTLWPNDGEIDIIESINMNPNNQMALHTTQGCMHQGDAVQSGHNVGVDCSTGSGCVVIESKPNSYQAGFAASGGGVWATQYDVTGVYIWFWSRADVPASVNRTATSIDISSWGPPSASFPANPQCNLTQFFTPQQLVLDITLCGDWAGVPGIYGPQCGSQGPTGKCYDDNVVGPGSPKYDNAFFEIQYVRTYTNTPAAIESPQSSTIPSTTPAGGSGEPLTVTTTSTAASDTTGSPPSLAGNTSSARPIATMDVLLLLCCIIAPIISHFL